MYGKLLAYLRDHRTRQYFYNFSEDSAALTSRDLTVFGYCVARGMEYLASKKVRNIFGFSRSNYRIVTSRQIESSLLSYATRLRTRPSIRPALLLIIALPREEIASGSTAHVHTAICFSLFLPFRPRRDACARFVTFARTESPNTRKAIAINFGATFGRSMRATAVQNVQPSLIPARLRAS